MAKITVQKTEINYGEFATNRNQAGLNSFNQDSHPADAGIGRQQR